jgi:hypothetical protein
MVTCLSVGCLYWTIHIYICTLHIRVLWFNCFVVWQLVKIMIFIIPYTFFEMPRYTNFVTCYCNFFVVLLGSGQVFEELINVCWIHTIKKDFPSQLLEIPPNTFRWALHTNLQLIKFNPLCNMTLPYALLDVHTTFNFILTT